MAITITPSYVKFIRGTPTAFQNLAVKDADTLYFISEVGASSGLLYLGDKLISGGSISSSISLGDLSDILLGANIAPNSMLMYDSTEGKWVNKTLAQVYAELISVFTGATASTAGTSGIVPAPQAGDQNKFLRGDGTWAIPAGAEDVTELRNIINTLVGDDDDKSVRSIAAEEVANIVGDAPDAYDTLKEIADWIESHPDDVSELVSRIEDLEDGAVAFDTRIGTLETDLGNLETRVGTLETSTTTLRADVDDIDSRLRWWELNDE